MGMERSRLASSLGLVSVIQTTLDGLRMPHARLIYPAGIQSFLTKSKALRHLRSAACGAMDGVAIQTMARGAKKNGLPCDRRRMDRGNHRGERRTAKRGNA